MKQTKSARNPASAPLIGDEAIPAELWSAICAEKDCEPYLVLSDWLQERQHPWGQLIMLAHQLEQRPGDAALAAAAEALMKKQGWLPKHKPEVLRLDWRWGFLRQVRVYDKYDDVNVAELAEQLSELPMAALLESFWLFRDGRFGDNTLQPKLRQLLPAQTDVALVRSYTPDQAQKKLEPEEIRWLDAAVPAAGEIKRYTQLRLLESNNARRLPEALAELPLERLDINWSHALRQIPDAVWGIESLGYISMYECYALELNMGQVNNLLAGFIRARTPRAQRIVEAGLLRGKVPKDVSETQLLAALDNNVKAVREAALAQLEERLESPLALRPIGEGSVVSVCGSLNLDKKALKARLEAAGAKVATKVTAKTTHVLLGQKPKGQQHDVGERALLLEKHLITSPLVKAVEAEAGGAASGGPDEAALAQALRSKQDKRVVETVAALQSLGAIPPALLPELFAVLQDTSLKGKGRPQAKKLFAAYAPKALQQAVAKEFKTSVLLAGESKRTERLTALARTAGKEIDVTRLARIFVEDHDCGYKYLFEQGDEQRDWALRQRISECDRTYGGPRGAWSWRTAPQGRCLDLSLLELSELPPLDGMTGLDKPLVELDATDNHLGSWPKNLPTSLTHVCLRENYLRSLPRSLSSFAALIELDLCGNRYMSFPKGATTLPALELLDLSSGTWDETRITAIPAEIAKLAATLKVLRIDNGRAAVSVPEELAALEALEELAITWEGDGTKVPAALKALLPSCKIS
jgi:hypothetical protein